MRLWVSVVIYALAFTASADVWYVPGWLKCHEPTSETLDGIRESSPDETVAFCDWDGNHGWAQSVTNAERHVERLVSEIMALDPSVRTNLTLVGHSLGGRIVVRALARLGERGCTVRRAVVLGAAMPCDDPDVAKAGVGAHGPVWLLSNRSDITLRWFYRAAPNVHVPALGLTGPTGTPFNCRSVVVPGWITDETNVKAHWGRVDLFKKVAAHHAVFYVSHMKKILLGERQ